MNKILLGDCHEVLKRIEPNSVDLIVTSPPYAMMRKTSYGGIPAEKYVDWFIERADEMRRVLKSTGSFIINIKEHVEDGERHTYVLELVLRLRETGWRWIDEFIWFKKNPMPGRFKYRFKDAWERIHHFSISDDFYVNQAEVAQPLKESSAKTYAKASQKDDYAIKSATGSGHVMIHNRALKSANKYGGKALPSNVIVAATETSNQNHSAVFPRAIPEFYIKSMCPRGGVVLDPFMGSGTTCDVAACLGREYIGIEILQEYYDNAVRRLEDRDPIFNE